MANFESILIITYGRSGSTLLMSALNSVDGVCIRGENYNFVFSLFEGYQRLWQARSYENATEPTHPWYGAPEIDPAAYAAGCGPLIRSALGVGPDCIFGFKEIRYFDVRDRLAAYLDFLSIALPNPAFLFNTRLLTDVARSGWWKQKPQAEVVMQLSEFEGQMRTAASRHPGRCFWMQYEEMKEHSARVGQMFDFLGLSYDAASIDSLLDRKHSVAT